MITTVLLAQEPTGPEFGKASPIGLVIVVFLLIGTVLLIRSMNKRLRKLPDTFEPDRPEPDQAVDEGTDPGVAKAAPDPDATAPGTDDRRESTDGGRPA